MSSIPCPHCNSPNRASAKFCVVCGGLLIDLTSESDPSSDLKGQILQGRYSIVHRLGQGGFGAVYRAWDANLKKPCAVKENLNATPEAQRQFEREATVLANLSHPNLPRVTDHFSISGQGQYLVMDYVDGEDIASRVGKQGAIAVEQALEWITQVADALTYLHTRKPPVVHRDIKPANIRITPEGRAMLVDFGLVKVYDPNLQTTLGARAVTPGYAPPEQYGQGVTDGRTDIYALGATLYNILTGQEPLESVQRMVGKQMPGANQVNPRVPEWLGQVVERAMQIEPGQRYQRAGEFKAAVSRPGSTMVVKPAGDAYVRPAAVPRTVSMPAPQSTSAAPAAPVRPASQPRRRNRRPLLWVGVAVLAILCLVGSLGFGALVAGVSRESAEKTSQDHARQTVAMRLQLTSTTQIESTATAYAKAQLQTTQTAQPYTQLMNSAIGWPSVISDNFNNNLNSWPTHGNDDEYAEISWKVEGGKYQVDAKAKKEFIYWFVPELDDYSNFYLAVDIKQVQGPENGNAGIVFRMKNSDEYFVFEIKNNGFYRVSEHNQDGWTDLTPWTETSSISSGKKNRLSLIAEETMLIVFINDQFIEEAFISQVSSGRPGLMVGLDEAGNHAIWEFDNYEFRVP